MNIIKMIVVALVLTTQVAVAQDSNSFNGMALGIGNANPKNEVVSNAYEVFPGLYHTPGYMPGYPTAATLWDRVVEVKCTKADGVMKCDLPEYSPSMGRGE